MLIAAASLALAAISAAPAHATVTPGCKDPVAYGAIANDNLDDRAAFQAAINAAILAQVDVCIPVGNFHLTRDFVTPGSLHSLKVTGRVRVTGMGQSVTTLHMLGTAIAPTGTTPSNWRVIDVRANDQVVIADLAIDGSQRINTGQQTHLIQLSGPTGKTIVERVTLRQPPLQPPAGWVSCQQPHGSGAWCHPVTGAVGWWGGGDCVRLVGEVGQPVVGTRLRHVRADNCDRAAFSIQRGVTDLVIEDSVGSCLYNQALEFEPSAQAAAPISDVTVRRSVFFGGNGLVAAIGGASDYPATDIAIEDTEMRGSVRVISATRVRFERVLINSGATSSVPTLYVHRNVSDLEVIDSQLVRPVGAPAAPVVRVSATDSQIPDGVLLAGTTLHQGTPDKSLDLLTARGVSMVGGSITTVATPNAIIYADAREGNMDTVTLSDVQVTTAGSRWLLNILGGAGKRTATAQVDHVTATGLQEAGVRYLLNTALPPSPGPSLVANTFAGLTAAQHCIGLGIAGCL